MVVLIKNADKHHPQKNWGNLSLKKNKNDLIDELTTDINSSITDLVKILLNNKADILDLKEEIANIKNLLNEKSCPDNI